MRLLKLFVPVLLSIILIVLDTRFSYLDNFKKFTLTLLSPIYVIVDLPNQVINWVNDKGADNEILIGELFNKIYKPTIAVVNKDVYAGGFLILAGCLFVVANNRLNFSLPEVKRGLFPMQVMASLINIMPKRKVLDWCVRGYSITAKEAHSLGLLSHICNEDEIHSVTNKLVEEIKENSPKAISLGLEAYDNLYNTNNEHEYLSEMLNKMQQNDDAKEGLSAFREKRKPNWTGN